VKRKNKLERILDKHFPVQKGTEEAVRRYYIRLLAEWVKTNGFEHGDSTIKDVMKTYLSQTKGGKK